MPIRSARVFLFDANLYALHSFEHFPVPLIHYLTQSNPYRVISLPFLVFTSPLEVYWVGRLFFLFSPSDNRRSIKLKGPALARSTFVGHVFVPRSQ